MQQWQKYLAEVLGTFILVLIGTMAIVSVNTAVGADGGLGLVMATVPLAFGFALLAGLYAFGEVSGGHFNPAVTLAMFVDRRASVSDLIGYWIAQVAGALLGSLTLMWMTNSDAVEATVNGYGGNGAGTGWISEVVLTAIFVMVILQVTRSSTMSNQGFVAIPLALVAIHYAGIPFSGASVNPARSIGPALVSGSDRAISELWVYLLAPLVGALVGWIVWKVVVQGDTDFRDDVAAIKEAATS
ncbi:MAG: aquaporin [Acidimicrobiia bacterium]